MQAQPIQQGIRLVQQGRGLAVLAGEAVDDVSGRGTVVHTPHATAELTERGREGIEGFGLTGVHHGLTLSSDGPVVNRIRARRLAEHLVWRATCEFSLPARPASSAHN